MPMVLQVELEKADQVRIVVDQEYLGHLQRSM